MVWIVQRNEKLSIIYWKPMKNNYLESFEQTWKKYRFYLLNKQISKRFWQKRSFLLNERFLNKLLKNDYLCFLLKMKDFIEWTIFLTISRYYMYLTKGKKTFIIWICWTYINSIMRIMLLYSSFPCLFTWRKSLKNIVKSPQN